MTTNNKKKSKLQQAAARKVAAIGQKKMSAFDIAHAMFHAEERGEVERVGLDDGSWGWLMPPDGSGQRPMMRPTPEVLAHLARIAGGDHGGAHG